MTYFIEYYVLLYSCDTTDTYNMKHCIVVHYYYIDYILFIAWCNCYSLNDDDMMYIVMCYWK